MSKDSKDKKLTLPEAVEYLRKGICDNKGLKERIDNFAKAALDLRKKESLGKAELEKKSPPGRAKEVEKLKAKGLPASEAFGIAWSQARDHGKPYKKTEEIVKYCKCKE